jgi:hypothetical protein
MRSPNRLTVPTCIGCGAMGTYGTCETGCREQRLDLVRGATFDSMTRIASDARIHAEAFRAVAEQLTCDEPPDDWEAAYRRVQAQARSALQTHPPLDGEAMDLDEPAPAATTWWCPECGGIDAPQPCLGICIWRPIEWVSKAVYDQARERALLANESEQRLRQLLRRVAAVTPRVGQWERGWKALHEQARAELGGVGVLGGLGLDG